MFNTNEPETHLFHKPRCEFVTQTMLHTNEQETHTRTHTYLEQPSVSCYTS